MPSFIRPRTLTSALAALALLCAAAIVLAAGPGSPRADAQTITTTCANASSDAATLNAAITASHAGDQILISGQCLLTAPVTLLGDRSYAGGSRTGTVLKQAAGANLSYLLASDSYVSNSATTGDPFAIRQLTIDCNSGANTAATNGLVLRSWQTQAQDLHIQNCHGSGILVTSTTPNGTTLTNTQVNGVIANNMIENCGKSGVYVQDSGNSVTDWHLDGNYISGSGQDAIHLENAAGWYIDGNHLYGDSQNGIYASRMYGTSITGNYIEDFGGAGGTSTWYGIDGTVQGDAASVIASNRVFMFGAEAAGASYRYIALTQVNYGTGQVAVTGNEIRGAGGAHDTGFFYSLGAGTGLTVASTGNGVSSVTTTRTTGTGVTISAGI
jgi:parallel beta-helix repeat protein